MPEILSIEKRNQAMYDTHLSICKQFANGTRKSYCSCHVSTEKCGLSCSMYWGVSSVIWMVLHQQADNNPLHSAPSASFQLVKQLLFFFPLAAAVECAMDLELGFISNLWEYYVQKNLASISDPFPELLLCLTHL
jgi:hypothetical protein